MDNPYLMAFAVVMAFLGCTSLWVGWIYFWSKISGHAWWGLVCALSPVFIGFYIFLVWRLSV